MHLHLASHGLQKVAHFLPDEATAFNGLCVSCKDRWTVVKDYRTFVEREKIFIVAQSVPTKLSEAIYAQALPFCPAVIGNSCN